MRYSRVVVLPMTDLEEILNTWVSPPGVKFDGRALEHPELDARARCISAALTPRILVMAGILRLIVQVEEVEVYG